MPDGLIAKGNWSAFLTLENEELLLVCRKHLFVVLIPIVVTSFFASILLFLCFYFFINTFYSIPLFITATLVIVTVVLSLITKCIIDWYFHIYIVTNRKMQEISYTPLTSHVASDVLLDKVNCTEVDLRVDGFINELLDIGDVVITFDRPTHQEEFVLRDIQNGNAIDRFLTQKLIDHQPRTFMQPIWFRRQPHMVMG